MPPEKRKNPPTVSVEDVKPARLERYRDINCLEKQVSEEEILQYNIEDLKTLQIRMCRMDLDQNREPAFQPCFFLPYKGELRAEPHYEEPERTGWKWVPYDQDKDLAPQRWAWMTLEYFHEYFLAQQLEVGKSGSNLPRVYMESAKKFGTRPLFELTGPNTVKWSGMGASLVDSGTPTLPHFMIGMISDINGEDDKITRGELLCLLRVMEKLLVVAGFVEYMITLVLLLSFMGPRHARVLQAYYDGKELVIHKTDLLDFTKDKNTDALMLLTRFAASTPSGDTVSEKQPIVS